MNLAIILELSLISILGISPAQARFQRAAHGIKRILAHFRHRGGPSAHHMANRIGAQFGGGARPGSSGINLKESIFTTFSDYATWTQYLCEKVLQAEDMKRVSICAGKLKRMGNELDTSSRQYVNKAADRLLRRSSQWISRNPNFNPPFDALAERYWDMIFKGNYFGAKREITAHLAHNDYLHQSINMKYVIIIAGLIQYDGMNPKAVLTLWDRNWNLNLEEKISALIRAKQLCIRARQGNGDPRHPGPFRPFNRINEVDARVLANLHRNVVNQFNENYIRGRPVEIGLLNTGMALVQTDYCRARNTLGSIRNMVPSNDPEQRVDINLMFDRAQEMCNRKQLDSTYRAFCQVGHETAFPIGEAITNSHTSHPTAEYERMFWYRIAAGDCQGARREYGLIRKEIPWDVIARREYLGERFKYMEEKLHACRTTPRLFQTNNGVGYRIFSALWEKQWARAQQEWDKQFAHIARTDYFSMLWKKVLMVSRFPKLIYAPCVGSSLLSGNPRIDRDLFEKLEAVAQKRPVVPCWQRDANERDLCNLLWVKAGYIAGDNSYVESQARWVLKNRQYCNEAYQLQACTTLCASGQGYQEACQAQKSYNRLAPNYRVLPHNRIGIDLATRMCSTNKLIVLDSFYFRYGNTPRSIRYLLRQYYKNFLDERRSIFPHHEGGGHGGFSGHRGPGGHGGPRVQGGHGVPKIHRGSSGHGGLGRSPIGSKSQGKPASVSGHPHHKLPGKKSRKGDKPSHHLGRGLPHPFGTFRPGSSGQKGTSTPMMKAASSIKVPPSHQQTALLQAQAVLCPCQSHKLIKAACPGGTSGGSFNVEALVQAFRKFIKKQHLPVCGCKKFGEGELAKSGALQVAANLIANGKMQCPCVKKSVFKKHGIKFNPQHKCSCPCKQSQSVHSGHHTNIPGLGTVHDSNLKTFVNHPLVKGTPACVRSLMQKFPFLKTFIAGDKASSKHPCKEMKRRVRDIFNSMMKQVDEECQRGMAQAMMKCHHHLEKK